MITGRGRTADLCWGGLSVAALLAVFAAGLPRDFAWGDHSVYYYRILDVRSIGLDARAYSLWALLGKPFLLLAPGIAGYHAYLVVLWVAQAVALYAAVRRLGAFPLLAASLVFAHGLGFPLRSVGLMSSPKILWLLVFDLFVIVFAGLERRAGARRTSAVVLLWLLLVLLHRIGILLGPAVLVGLAVAHPGRRSFRLLPVLAAAGVCLAVYAFVDRSSSGSGWWSFFLSHLRVEWPRAPLRSATQVGAILLTGGTAGLAVLLPGFGEFLRRRALATLLALFALASVAFAVMHPSGEKAMFLLPALHCGVLGGAMMSVGAARARVWPAVAIAAVSICSVAAVPHVARAWSRVEVLESEWHDYPRCVYGLRAPRPAVDYARAILTDLSPQARLHFGDWGVKPVFEHLRRTGEWTPDGGGDRYLVVSPWRNLPERAGAARIEPIQGLVDRGLMAGRLRAPE